MNKIYACIDLKSFYASVECVERNLDPLNTNLVVADASRTSKTVCLAVTPSLKKYGIKGRARLFEVQKKVKEVNYERYKNNKYKKFVKKSFDDNELTSDSSLEIDYIVAPPRMKKYIEYSTNIYNIYLKYLSSDDIYVYSIDEVFCDLTNYLKTYKMSPEELITKMIKDVYDTYGITATAGIGTNLYLAKVSMDIVAKHANPNSFGVRIAYLDIKEYRKKLWNHRPITSFWRFGVGIKKRLEKIGIYTMGDLARASLKNEALLYKIFGVNAEILIDHAWGYEPVSISDIKKYKPKQNSISSGQVLHEPYSYTKARLIVREMIELLSLDLINKNKSTKNISITIHYDISNIDDKFAGEMSLDHYGRCVPKESHSSITLENFTSRTTILSSKCIELFDSIAKKDLLIRKISISLNNLSELKNSNYEQLDLFSKNEIKINPKEELILQSTLLNIKNKYGKNSILKGMNLEDGATTIERNRQVGGHSG